VHCSTYARLQPILESWKATSLHPLQSSPFQRFSEFVLPSPAERTLTIRNNYTGPLAITA